MKVNNECGLFILRSEFAGIRKNSTFAQLIQKSFANQTVTLARTVEEDEEQMVYRCSYCDMVMIEVKGDWDCSHCGANMTFAKEGNSNLF